jgi:hypothetical protein
MLKIKSSLAANNADLTSEVEALGCHLHKTLQLQAVGQSERDDVAKAIEAVARTLIFPPTQQNRIGDILRKPSLSAEVGVNTSAPQLRPGSAMRKIRRGNGFIKLEESSRSIYMDLKILVNEVLRKSQDDAGCECVYNPKPHDLLFVYEALAALEEDAQSNGMLMKIGRESKFGGYLLKVAPNAGNLSNQSYGRMPHRRFELVANLDLDLL